MGRGNLKSLFSLCSEDRGMRQKRGRLIIFFFLQMWDLEDSEACLYPNESCLIRRGDLR